MSTKSRIEYDMNQFREEWNKRWNELRAKIDATIAESDATVERCDRGTAKPSTDERPPTPVSTAWQILGGVQAAILRGEIDEGADKALELGRGIGAMEILLRWDAARWRNYVEGGVKGVPMAYSQWMYIVYHNRPTYVHP